MGKDVDAEVVPSGLLADATAVTAAASAFAERFERVFGLAAKGYPEAQVAIAPKIRALGLDTLVPEWREIVELT